MARTALRLGIDLDGVVCDFNAGWMELHKAEFGSELVPEMVVTWDNLHELGGFKDMKAFWRWAQGNEDRPSIFPTRSRRCTCCATLGTASSS
jgi:uncharacterized HAD superfamily protein